MAQLYYSPVTVNTGQVPSTQTDFPVLVSYTDARFKDVAHSGHVKSSSGFDIRPYSDSALTTALTYELERYNAATGEVVMWVKRSSLADGNVTYLGYGDTTLTTDGSSTATWSNHFIVGGHFADGTTLSLANFVAGGSAFTNIGTNHVTAGTGKIDGCGAYASASSEGLQINGMTNTTAITYSAWINATTLPNDYNGVVNHKGTGVDQAGFFVKSNGKLYMVVQATTTKNYDGTGSHTISTGNWYLIHLTYDSSQGLIGYVNASSDQTATANGNVASSAYTIGAVGYQSVTGTRFWNGLIDEVHVCDVARSANWITTEYNNQNAPSTFATLGTEVATGAGTTQSGWFVFF